MKVNIANLREKNSGKQHCPLCRWSLDNGEATTICPHDEIKYHHECLLEMGACRCNTMRRKLKRSDSHQLQFPSEDFTGRILACTLAGMLAMLMVMYLSKIPGMLLLVLTICYFIGDSRE